MLRRSSSAVENTADKVVRPSVRPSVHLSFVVPLDDQSSRTCGLIDGTHARRTPTAQPRERVVATTVDNSLPRRVEDAYLLRVASRRFGALGPRRPGTRTVRQLPLPTYKAGADRGTGRRRGQGRGEWS